MTKKAVISNAELKRFAEVASTEGVTIEVVRDGTLVRVMPFHPSQVITREQPREPTREEKSAASLQKWLANRDAKRAKGRP